MKAPNGTAAGAFPTTRQGHRGTDLTTPDTLAGDLLTGCAEIANYLGWPESRVYAVAAAGGYPIFKIRGAGIQARKSTLVAYIEAMERAAVDKTNVDQAGQAA